MAVADADLALRPAARFTVSFPSPVNLPENETHPKTRQVHASITALATAAHRSIRPPRTGTPMRITKDYDLLSRLTPVPDSHSTPYSIYKQSLFLASSRWEHAYFLDGSGHPFAWLSHAQNMSSAKSPPRGGTTRRGLNTQLR